MTRLFVDDREIAPPIDMSSLDELLRHVETAYLAPGTVVRQIQVDGLALQVPSAEEKSGILSDLDQREKIEVFTGTLTEIAQDSIAEALQYLGRVEAATPSIINSFQSSPRPESFEGLRQLYEGLYWLSVLQAKLRSKFQLNLDDVCIQGSPAQEHQAKFIAILKQLIESQQKRDFMLISDLLEYEILPLVPVWKELFGAISEKINAAP